MPEPFPIVDVSSWRASHDEAMGSKAKLWLASPDGEYWLFKQVRTGGEQAEDWPEKAAAELAGKICVPAATAELASYRERRGVISLNVTHGRDLVHGNELLYDRDPSYERDKPRSARGYTLTAISNALSGCPPPPGWPRLDWSAYDVFAGYLLLDALIANQDRHHENWAVLVDPASGRRALSPSFDHASSLGFMLTDIERRGRLTTRDRGRSVEHWAGRGRSPFEDRPLLVDLARQALQSCSPEAAIWWLERLRSLKPTYWETILDRIPGSRVSEAARTFACEVLSVNRRRLLDACGVGT